MMLKTAYSINKALGLLTIILMVTSCVAPPPTPSPLPLELPTPSPTTALPSPQAEVIEITVGNAPSEENAEDYERFMALIALFESTHPNIKINPDIWKWNYQEFAADLAAGKAADMIAVPATEGPLVIEQGYAADLTPLAAKWAVSADFNDAILAPYTKDRHLYAIPAHVYIMGLFYDKKLFRDAGLVDSNGEPVPPTTWEEFVTTAQEIKAQTGAAGFCMFTTSNQGGWTFMNWGWQAGGEFERKEDGAWRAVFAEEPIVHALQFLKDLHWEHDVLQDNLELDAGASFAMVAKHECGMAIYAPEWFNIIITEHGGNLEDLGITVLPAGPGGSANLMGGVFHIINAASPPQVQEATFEWLTWSNFDPTALEHELKLRAEQARLSTAPRMPMFKPNSETAKREKELFDKYRNVLYYKTYVEGAGKYARPEPPIAAQDLYAALDEVIQAVLNDKGADPQTLLTEAAQQFQVNHLDSVE